MEKYGFIYIWLDRKHKRYYVGCHWGHENDGYVCSSTWMRNSYNRRPQDFKRRIIKRIYTSRADMFIAEEKYLSMIKVEELKIRYYNFNRTNGHWSQYEDHIKTIAQKISVKTKEAMRDPTIRARYEEALSKRDNRSSDPEVLEKRRQSMKKTMAEKFPVESRKKHLPRDSDELNVVYRQKSVEMWNDRSEDEKAAIGSKISESLKSSKEVRSAKMSSLKWWNNGIINTRKATQPGPEWVLGRMAVGG